MSDTAEARLLLAILQRRWADAERIAARRAGGGPAFAELCRSSDVPTWVHAVLDRERRADLIGREAMDSLAALRARVQRDNLLLFARAEQAIDALLAAGIVPVVLKGLEFVHRLYERFDERTLDDVDLLVEPARLRGALRALADAGCKLPEEPRRTHYIRSSHHLPFVSPGPLPVEFELHWDLAQQGRFRVDVPGLFARARPCRIGDREVRRLGDEDAAAHLVLHHFTHYFDRRLKWAVDLHKLAAQPGFDWPLVADRLDAWGARAVSAASLRHLAKTVPDWIPRAVLERLPLARWRRLLAAPLRSSYPLDLYRGTRARPVQLYLAAVLLERPALLPGWLLHRVLRDRRPGANPLDNDGAEEQR